MTARIAVVLAAALALPAIATAKPNQDAGAYMRGVLFQVVHGQYEKAWATLHPAQQKIVPFDAYVKCSAKSSPLLSTITDIEVVTTYSTPPESIPGTGLSAKTSAVTLKIASAIRTETDTFHAILVGGHWRWITDSTAIAAYRAHRCP